MTKTKVLLLTPQTPYPPDQGAPIRNFSFVRYLGSSSEYELNLLTFARSEEGDGSEAAWNELQKYCYRVEVVAVPPTRSKFQRLKAQVLGQQPDLALRLGSAKFASILKEWLWQEQFEVVQCEGLELAPFVLKAFENWKGPRPRLVLDEHNAEYLLQRRVYQSERALGFRRLPAALYSLLQAQRLYDYEAKALRFFDRAIAVSENEQAALSRLAPDTTIEVIPNGIDLEEFAPGANAEEATQLVFTGTMDFRPNVDAVTWFARLVWPMIRQARPEARFIIVGRRPDPAVEALKGIPGIEVTGRVADARPYLRQSTLFVLPMRMGGGVRFKLLEALAMGKAVVTTSFGADGVPLTAGREAVFADNPLDFAQHCLALLDDPAQRIRLGEAGRAFVAAHFDWRSLAPSLDRVLK
ncbi:MAG: glycosyltransferase [Chloroflexota bacterium]|nr:glycosyltransferase [Chloroflexota bacterium]